MKKVSGIKYQVSSIQAIREMVKYATGLGKIWDKDTPSQLIFFVTNRCNARCSHCFYWRNLNKKVGEELSVDEISKISKSIGKLIWFFISGGEPFLRNDLDKICEIFYKNNKPNSIIIPTNGFLVERILSSLEEILKSCTKSKIVLQISIDEIGEKHDKMRGLKNNFAKIEELIPKLKKLQKKYKNLAIAANIVYSSLNEDSVSKTYDYLKEKFKIDNTCISLVRGEPKEIGVKNINLKKYQRIHKNMQETRRFLHYNKLLSYLITKKEDMQVDIFLKSLKEKKAVVPCLSGRQSAVLYPNGDLGVCELRKEKLGNLRDVNYDFKKLWLSEKAKEIREKIKGCYCTQECVYTTNVFLNPKVWPVFLKYLVFNKI